MWIPDDDVLWFDVEKERYTTHLDEAGRQKELWFDVEKERYTTIREDGLVAPKLWFDVEKERYTTDCSFHLSQRCCGLM